VAELPADRKGGGAVPRVKEQPPVATTTPPVRVIPDDAIFRLHELRAVLGLPMTTLRREARKGRLRVSRRAGCYWTTGAWVREWMLSGEVVARPKGYSEVG
jgi:hypothetical protein